MVIPKDINKSIPQNFCDLACQLLCTELGSICWGGRGWAEESIAKKRKEEEKKPQLLPKNAVSSSSSSSSRMNG